MYHTETSGLRKCAALFGQTKRAISILWRVALMEQSDFLLMEKEKFFLDQWIMDQWIQNSW